LADSRFEVAERRRRADTLTVVSEILYDAGIISPGGVDLEALDRLLYDRPAWHAEAKCKGMLEVCFGPDRAPGEAAAEWEERAKAVCATCPVRAACGEAGRAERYGVWGGMTPKGRNAARRRRAA
jgi:WhiB family redox-sensing transcriptional regulator